MSNLELNSLILKQRLRFIINPIAGTKFKVLREQSIAQVIDNSKFDFDVVYTERAGHAKDLAKAAVDEGIDIVAIAGGDGSINEAARGIKFTNTKMAIIPIGSGNGVARKLNIPLKPIKALRLINNAEEIVMDAGEVNGEFFLMSPGVGFDAAMLKTFDQFEMRGVWGYLKSLFMTSGTFEPFNVKLDIDGLIVEKEVFSVLLSNIGQLGYGIVFDKKSVVNDGELELVIMESFPKWKVLWYVIVAFFLDPEKAKPLSRYRFKRLTGSLSSQQCLQIDGDYKKEVNDIKVHVIDKAVKVLVPKILKLKSSN